MTQEADGEARRAAEEAGRITQEGRSLYVSSGDVMRLVYYAAMRNISPIVGLMPGEVVLIKRNRSFFGELSNKLISVMKEELEESGQQGLRDARGFEMVFTEEEIDMLGSDIESQGEMSSHPGVLAASEVQKRLKAQFLERGGTFDNAGS